MKRLISAIVLALCFAGPSSAETETIRISTGEYAPFASASLPGGGIVNSHITEIAAAAGFEVEFDYMPWLRALEMARIGRFDATSYWYYNEEREAEFIHVGPIIDDRIVFFHRADLSLPEWSDIQDLDGMRIGAVAGYTYTPDFWTFADAGTITVETAQSDAANMRKLLAGRIDLYPMSEESGRLLMETIFSEAERAALTFDPQPLVTTSGYMLIPRQNDRADEIAQALQSALAAIEVAAR